MIDEKKVPPEGWITLPGEKLSPEEFDRVAVSLGFSPEELRESLEYLSEKDRIVSH